MVSGLTAAIGYAARATAGALARTLSRRRSPRATRWAWWLPFVVAPLPAGSRPKPVVFGDLAGQAAGADATPLVRAHLDATRVRR